MEQGVNAVFDPAEHHGGNKMQKWEYLHLTIAYADSSYGVGTVKYIDGREIQNWKQTGYLPNFLNELGEQGWELVEVIWRMKGSSHGSTNIDPIYILKRPKL